MRKRRKLKGRKIRGGNKMEMKELEKRKKNIEGRIRKELGDEKLKEKNRKRRRKNKI